MRLLVFGDLHIADKAPSGRVDDYMQTMLGKLASISQLCKEYKVKYALGLGDIYHIKQANRVSDTLRQQLIRMFKSFPCPVYVLPGNHDYGPAGLESIPHQPLGTLAEADAVKLVRSIEDTRLGFWLVPRPYDAKADGFYDGEVDPSYYSLTEEEQTLIQKNPVPVIGVAHGSILGPGDTRPYPYVNVDQIPGIEKYDLLIAGHIHESLGVMQVGKTIFANPGSIGRTTRNLSNYARTVEVLVVSADEKGLTVEEVPLPGVAPALEVFGNREATDSPDQPDDEIRQFTEALGAGLRADELSIPELMATIEAEPEVKAEVARLLEEAS